MAASALGKLGDPRCVRPLVGALFDDDFRVREAAAKALGKMRDGGCVDPLISALKDEHRWVRRNAAEALGKICDPRGVDPLIRALEDEDAGVRADAARALDEISHSKAADPQEHLTPEGLAESVEEAAFSAFSELSAPATTRRVDDLLHALEDGDWVNRLDAARSLGEIVDERVIRPLAHLASEDDSSWVRAMVASSLVKLGKRGLLERIIEALYDEDPVVRRNAAAALGEIGDPQAKEALTDLLKDEAEAVRRAAQEALEEIGAY